MITIHNGVQSTISDDKNNMICGFNIWDNKKLTSFSIANGYVANSVKANGGMVLLRLHKC